MRAVICYPGTFGPPTYGHLHLLEQAAELFPEVRVVCSVNPDKDGLMFTQEEAVALWRGYRLPEGTVVETLADFAGAKHGAGRVLMVRGIRDEDDAEYEKGVMMYNRREFGIGKFLFLMADPEFHDISSSKARRAAAELRFEDLPRLVSPRVVTALLERSLGVANVILVVGPPGGGKSTLMRALRGIDDANVHVDTDRFLDDTKDAIRERFGMEPHRAALAHNDELTAFLAPLWFDRLRTELYGAPDGANVFVEVPYAMQPGKRLYRNLGGKVLFVQCSDRSEQELRLADRGTAKHIAFIDRIPGLKETRAICAHERLLFADVNTAGDLSVTVEAAHRVNDGLANGSLWRDPS